MEKPSLSERIEIHEGYFPDLSSGFSLYNPNAKRHSQHFFTRFIGEYIDVFGDPALGRIMVSLGTNESSLNVYKGDINLWWAWGYTENWVQDYICKVKVKPSVCLGLCKTMIEKLNDEGLETVYAPLGVGSNFKPLHKERSGVTYIGGPWKTESQMDMIVTPFKDKPYFEWIQRDYTKPVWELDELNEYYNKKQIALGMVHEFNIRWGLVSNRIPELFASGTPLINSYVFGFKELFGFEYPYFSHSSQQTLELADYILSNYSDVQREFEGYSKMVLENHRYINRWKTIFEKLKR